MKFKNIPKQKILIFIIMGFISSGCLIFTFILKTSTNNVEAVFTKGSTVDYQKEKVDTSLPVRIKIPKIKVNSIIESIGLTPDGAVDVPKGPYNTSWFNLGAIPGKIGNSVVTGHSGWRNGIPAAFDSLYKLKKGDYIYIENGKGETIAFIVREIKSYTPNQYAPEVFISSDGKSHLNLITCSGIWNAKEKSHSNRLVVFADGISI